jgi:hypothetical protein
VRRLLLSAPILLLNSPLLLRRGRRKPTRDDAFQELFALNARVYEAAARLKPHWHAEWSERTADDLPPKYAIEDPIAVAAARDMRYATALLQRNRWRSKVQPLFDTVDTAAWSAFQGIAANQSIALLDIADERIDLLLEDERDWIVATIEQLDAATLARRDAERTNAALSTFVAESVYQAIYIAIQLSDRLIDRRRQESEQRR